METDSSPHKNPFGEGHDTKQTNKRWQNNSIKNREGHAFSRLLWKIVI